MIRIARCVGVVAALVLAMAPHAYAAAGWSLLPQPVDVRQAQGHPVEIPNGATIQVRGADPKQVLGIVDRFMKQLADVRGLQLHVVDTVDAHPAITFDVDPHADVASDAGYRIDVNEHGIRVSARKPEGVFYASVTVFQLLTQPGWKRGAAAEVSAGNIIDHPRFAWRALMLDSGRHFQSVAEIKQLIEWMSLDKLNVLVWHLTEDQGWRLDIPKYPELTRIGACRKPLGVDVELTGAADRAYCGFYTADEVRDVVRFAAERFITVVPDLDLPGHSQAAVASYPWLGVTGERPSVWSEWGISPWLLKPDAKTLQFVDDVLDEVMRLFPSPYVGIGGDEAAKDQWNASAEVRAQMHKLGLKNMDELQGWFTQQVADHLIKHGRKPVGWDDEIAAGAKLPAAEVVMSWHGNDGERIALDALRQGHDVIMTPQESLYFDHYQSDRSDEWSGPPPMATLQQTYDTVLIPQGATALQALHIIGVQACLWTEQMPTFADDQHAIFPRLAALAELGWSPADAHDWNGFAARLPAELARYGALGIGYADSAFAPAFHVSAANDGALRVTLSNQTGFGSMHYTTDGSEPTATSSSYTQPIEFSPREKMALRATTFASDGSALSAPRSQRVDADALLTRNGSDLALCSDQSEPMRVVGVGATKGPRPIYKSDVRNMCWRWPRVSLDNVNQVALTIGRVAWQFGDEAAEVVVRPQTGAASELDFHSDACDGPVLARVPLPPFVAAPIDVTANVTTAAGAHDVCVVATGDPREGVWTLAQIRFQKDGAR
jgi:hexosaminidase